MSIFDIEFPDEEPIEAEVKFLPEPVETEDVVDEEEDEEVDDYPDEDDYEYEEPEEE